MSRDASILKAGKARLRWLFNPAPFLTAVRLKYRRAFLLATGLFVVSGLVGFVAALHSRDADRGMERQSRVERRKVRDAAREQRRALERLLERLGKTLEEGDAEERAIILSSLDLDDLRALRPRPRASEVLPRAWLVLLLAVMANTLLCVVLGFILGLYPAGVTVAIGLALGFLLSTILRVGGGAALAMFLPIWLLLVLLVPVGLLSAAIGLDTARWIAQGHAGDWFKDHIRMGLRTWGTAVVPAILVAMILLGGVFATIVLVSGNPVVE